MGIVCKRGKLRFVGACPSKSWHDTESASCYKIYIERHVNFIHKILGYKRKKDMNSIVVVVVVGNLCTSLLAFGTRACPRTRNCQGVGRSWQRPGDVMAFLQNVFQQVGKV